MTDHHVVPEDFFDLAGFRYRDLFSQGGNVWEALDALKVYLEGHLEPWNVDGIELGKPFTSTVVLWKGEIFREGFEILGGDVAKGTFLVRIGGEETTEATVIYAGSVIWDPMVRFGRGTVVEPGALIKGPTLIGEWTEIRQAAYIRGTCLIGDRCVVGHATEVKASIFLDGAKAGHFAYVGDSILGSGVNLGAGTKLANLKIKGGHVVVRSEKGLVETGRRKLGAILGDGTEIGCNAVTNPGAFLGKKCLVMPLASIPAGIYPSSSFIRAD